MGKKRKAPKGCFWKDGILWGAKMVNGIAVRWPLKTDNPTLARKYREETLTDAVARRLERLGFDQPHLAGRTGGRTYDDALGLLPDYFADRCVAEDTQDEYLGCLARIDEYLTAKELTAINGEVIAGIVRGRRASGVTNATIKRNLNALSALMNAAISKGWLDANPVLPVIKQIKEKRDPIVMPERAHIDLVISRCPGMIAHMAEFACRTGAREDELLKLRRSDVDHDRRQMIVRRIGKGGPKGGKTRVVDLVPFDGYDYLRALPAYVGSDIVFWHQPRSRLGDKAAASPDYKNFASQFSAIVSRTAAWAKENGVAFRPFRFHDLRHYHAVEFLKSGRDIYDLQKRLGHSSVKVTEMYLAYLTAEEERVAKFGKAAGGGR